MSTRRLNSFLLLAGLWIWTGCEPGGDGDSTRSGSPPAPRPTASTEEVNRSLDEARELMKAGDRVAAVETPPPHPPTAAATSAAAAPSPPPPPQPAAAAAAPAETAAAAAAAPLKSEGTQPKARRKKRKAKARKVSIT